MLMFCILYIYIWYSLQSIYNIYNDVHTALATIEWRKWQQTVEFWCTLKGALCQVCELAGHRARAYVRNPSNSQKLGCSPTFIRYLDIICIYNLYMCVIYIYIVYMYTNVWFMICKYIYICTYIYIHTCVCDTYDIDDIWCICVCMIFTYMRCVYIYIHMMYIYILIDWLIDMIYMYIYIYIHICMYERYVSRSIYCVWYSWCIYIYTYFPIY